MKIWNFDKEAAQNFLSGANDHCLWQGMSEDENFDAKPTQSKFQIFNYVRYKTPKQEMDLVDQRLKWAQEMYKQRFQT